jgi:tetratricopeptide repeat protein 21B
MQKDVVSQLRSKASQVASTAELMESEKAVLSEICEQLATAHVECLGVITAATSAMEMYYEATQYNPQNTSAVLGIAKLLKRKSSSGSGSNSALDDCAAHCQKVLHLDPRNEEAAILLSEALFAGANVPGARATSAAAPSQQVSSTASTASATSQDGKDSNDSASNVDNAVAPLQQFLEQQPNNYHALEKMIVLLRRGGKLEVAPAYLKAAEVNDRRATAHAGLHFCHGLYARYTNDIGKAIAEFNLARRDDKWGHDALVHMIELYLNPDQDGAWDERTDGPVDDNTSLHIAAADTLLKELEPKAKYEYLPFQHAIVITKVVAFL